ncbi:expressed unknown protein [Seminavis robusta]|uniref:Wax synthase domain-containing protein n=1 Tax=Seminavis robusta TaxID=568900 RepID=A0A9N8EI71_9STRA|nr:expressed unknown protein [Seminavis robusta]|eukprot:Sro1264_g257400.1 n/a (366) ;mRNA; f:27179-28276
MKKKKVIMAPGVDVIVSIVEALPTVGLACVLARTSRDAILFTTVFWMPLFALPWIKQRKPLAAAGVNAVGLLIVVWQIQDQQVLRPFATAISLFAIIKAYDFAIHFPDMDAARHYAGTVFFLNITQRKHVPSIADCFPMETMLDLVVTGLVIVTSVIGIYLCQECQSPEYPMVGLQLPSNWLDWSIMHIRCGLIGIAFGYTLNLLKFVYQLWYAPFRIVHTEDVMNHPLLATSLMEFWSYRWNRLIHGFLKRNIYLPLCKQPYCNEATATMMTFAFAGVFHVLLLEAGTKGSVAADLGCMAFFLCQAPLMFLETKLFTKRKQSASTSTPTTPGLLLANRLFVFVSLLATAPLLIEPCLRSPDVKA